ncbi:MAG: tetratricopeptide repeat protein, partial [Proteobacteria bacterium]|nr:tetratricopeptide repeat protein [Pseudomonadota bacterium]
LVVLVEPQTADDPGVAALGRLLAHAPNKAEVLVVARAFNPFAYVLSMPGIAVSHLKGRGKAFLKKLPPPPDNLEQLPAQKIRAGKVTDPLAPRFCFVGRDEEMETLGSYLTEGGPIVVSGASGVGKSWLIDHAIAKSGLERLPDLVLGRGVGADALVARMAVVARVNGCEKLWNLLQDDSRTPVTLVQTMLESLREATTDGQVMVVRDLHRSLGREADFFRKSRLELLLQALLRESYPLRLIFESRRQPVFYREGAAKSLRRLELQGIKGRFYYDIFDAHKAPEFPRDKIGPLTEKLHGHPMAIRAYALAVRDSGVELLDDPKFMRMKNLEDIGPVRKALGKRMEKLSKNARHAFSKIAHLSSPATGALLAELGIGRRGRLELLASGLLDMAGTEKARMYTVHPLVRTHLSFREITDFDILGHLAELYAKLARESQDVQQFTYFQEANLCAITARQPRRVIKLSIPDQDGILEDLYGLIRGQRPNYSLGQQRIIEMLSRDHANTDAHLAKIELLSRMREKPEFIADVVDEAIEKAAAPELFHQAVGHFLGRRSRNKAVSILEKAVELMPDESRLRTRLAALLLRQGRRPEAIEHLNLAMEQEPMLPDAYGLLGMARRAEGVEVIEEAETLLREAVRLAPADPVQVSRLVSLLLDRARGEEKEKREAIRAEAREHLENVMRTDRKAPEICLLMAALVREEGAEPERAAWFLKKARKTNDRNQERMQRIQLEQARLDIIVGELDSAEATIRDLGHKDPSNAKI